MAYDLSGRRVQPGGIDREDIEQVQNLLKTLRETAADLLDKGVTDVGIRVNIEAVIDGEEA